MRLHVKASKCSEPERCLVLEKWDGLELMLLFVELQMHHERANFSKNALTVTSIFA